MLQYLHTALMALLFGLLIPMLPFFFLMNGMGRLTDLNPFYDPISPDRTFYAGFYPKNNELSLWMQVFGYSSKFIDSCKSPLLIQLGWALFSNCLVIVLSRTNKQIGSHKKHLLQALSILVLNMLVGNPKIHSFNGCLMLAIMLSIILYSEFSTLALILSVSPHSNYLDMYLGKWLPFQISYFLVYFLHFYFAAYIFRNFMT